MFMKSSPLFVILFLMILLSSCQQTTITDIETIEKEIASVLYDQAKYWNEGDIEKYMGGYHQSDSLRFASGGIVSYGWETTLERYKSGYPDRVAMGILTFSDINITVVSKDAAFVFGKWALQKVDDMPWGLFTLVFRKTEDGWRIVHDHTSAGENEPLDN